jgi:hypothetical protein
MREFIGCLSQIRRVALLAILAAASITLRATTTKGPDAAGYTGTDVAAYSFVDVSGANGGTAILAGTDDATAALTLPFAFSFYGQAYNLVCISSNGALYFVTSEISCSSVADFSNTDLTSVAAPGDRPALLPFWSDLTFEVPGAGAVFYRTLGTAGSRRFIVQWQNAYPQGSPNPVIFQIVLSETTNRILFQYKSIDLGLGNPATGGGQATIGIRDGGALTNQHQIAWSFDAPVVHDDTAVLFSPGSVAPSAPTISVTGGAFVYDGGPHPATATATGTNGAAVPGAFTFSYGPGGSAPPTNGGTYAVTASFVSSDPGYSNGSGATTITINPAAPTITWASPAAIREGTALDATRLNATVNAPGTLTYTPTAGTLLDDGVATLSVSFAPANPANYQAATKTVALTVLPTPGELEGAGQISVSGIQYDFLFHVRERASGSERGTLEVEVERVGRESRANHIGTFVSTGVNPVTFSNDPRITPSRGPKPTIDTATFSGAGKWNGALGYTFTAQASDAGEPGAGRDSFTITIRSPQGVIVATVNGTISGGNIQSNRLR